MNLRQLRRKLFRNRYGIFGKKADRNRVNIEYAPGINIGDVISPIIVNWMLEQRNIDTETSIKGIKHLTAIGSVVGWGGFDTTVWGSGVISEDGLVQRLLRQRRLGRKLDIRAVRGPRTREILLAAGYSCPETYGDPAIILPRLYNPGPIEMTHDVTLILHHATDPKKYDLPRELTYVNPTTTDYVGFVQNIVSSKRVISSSLHGIILSESYGVPAVFLSEGDYIPRQHIKFRDWYESTARPEFPIADSIEEAMETTPIHLPLLDEMRNCLMDTFPYDLWTNRNSSPQKTS